MSDDPAQTCSECGAAQVEGMDCWGQLGAILAWEAQDPDLAAEHFLTVASYNLQHPAQFTDEAISGLRATFIEHLDHGTPPSELRRRAARAYQGKRRVLRHESEREPLLRPWPMTIADVYIPDKPQGAAQRVRQWAASIRTAL
jgi:Family of unknown function (DUF5946)